MLSEVDRFAIRVKTVRATLEALRSAGRTGNEAFVLWGGRIRDRECAIEQELVPSQIAHRTEHGLLVTIPGDALHEANVFFYERSLVLAAQVHSHPTSAFHSETDNHYPLATLEGALSIVVPYFGLEGGDPTTWVVYRLSQGKWKHVSRRKKRKLIEVVRS